VEKILSNYYELNDKVKKQYIDKVKKVNGIDPYFRMEKKLGGDMSASIEWLNWPDVSYADIYNYLIFSLGFSMNS